MHCVFFSLSRRIWTNRVASEIVEPTYTARHFWEEGLEVVYLSACPHQELWLSVSVFFLFPLLWRAIAPRRPQGPNVDSGASTSRRSLAVVQSIELFANEVASHASSCLALVTELLCALDHSSNAFALAQGCRHAELHLSPSQVESVGGPRDPRQQQQSHNLAASRCGHHSRLDDVAAADQTGDGSLLAAGP